MILNEIFKPVSNLVILVYQGFMSPNFRCLRVRRVRYTDSTRQSDHLLSLDTSSTREGVQGTLETKTVSGQKDTHHLRPSVLSSHVRVTE